MEEYAPKSDFLRLIVHDEIPFGDDPIGKDNLRQLIALMKDEDKSNRDWATFLLGQMDEHDSSAIRQALLVAAGDEDFDTRCEAILGLARRDAPEAFELVQAALEEDRVGMLIVEAAGFVARRELVPLLESLRPWDEAEYVLGPAIAACEAEVPVAM